MQVFLALCQISENLIVLFNELQILISICSAATLRVLEAGLLTSPEMSLFTVNSCPKSPGVTSVSNLASSAILFFLFFKKKRLSPGVRQ